MARLGVALWLLGFSAGCSAHGPALAPAEVAARPLAETRDVAVRGAAPTEVEESVDEEVKRREARLKLAQARAAGCGVGLR